jgi:hypothetical protein
LTDKPKDIYAIDILFKTEHVKAAMLEAFQNRFHCHHNKVYAAFTEALAILERDNHLEELKPKPPEEPKTKVNPKDASLVHVKRKSSGNNYFVSNGR